MTAEELGGGERPFAGKLDRQERDGSGTCGDNQAVSGRIDNLPGVSLALGDLRLVHNPSDWLDRRCRSR